ncbi:MAG: TonB-dependent receptor [Chitinophagaceae bacterium]
MRKFMLLMSYCLLLLCGQAMAQTRTISGTVRDAKGTPVPNATVIVKGTNVGTSTKVDGTFSLSVPASAKTLVISSVGLEPQDVSIPKGNAVSVELREVNKNLDEVVVVAYGTVKKSEYTGSAAQISAKDIENRPISNVSNALVGSAPGIQTTTASGAPGSSAGVRLRGFTSYSSGSSPLYVVDGVPYDGGLANINPDDVETISTLKDASTTALYGSRGANGVIMITTKKGKKNKNNVSFKAVKGYTDPAYPQYDRVNVYEYYPLMWESYRNSLAYTNGQNLATASQTATNGIKALLGYNPYKGIADNAIVGTDGTLNPNAKELLWGNDLDWIDAGTRRGKRDEYGLSYSGGNDKSDYFGSFSYTKEQGWANRSDMRRFAGRVSVNTQPLSWFRTGFNLSGSMVDFNNAATSGIVNPFYFARYIGPIYPVFAHNPTTGDYLLDGTGQKMYDYGSLTQYGLPSRPYNTGRHTIAENLWNRDMTKRNIISARTFGELIFTSYLRFTTNISVDITDAKDQTYDNPLIGDGAPSGRASMASSKTTSYTLNQLLNFAKKFGDHNVTALVGHENYDYTSSSMSGMRQGQIVEGVFELPNFTTINSLSSGTTQARIESYLSKVGYDYQSKYFVTGSFRRDGNSKFARKVRWDNFWSIGGAWRIDKESFFKAPWVDMLKLRGSYGKVGNDQVGSYPYQDLYTIGRNNAAEPGMTQATLGNDSLTWETAKSLDLGVDFSFFQGRLTGSVEYFHRTTDGMIFGVPVPLQNGGTNGGAFSVTKNIGSLYNKGIEAQVSGDIVRGKDFTWNMTINFTTFKNRMTKMPDATPEIQSGNQKLKVGVSIYDFYMRHYYGVDPTDGAALYAYNVWSAANCRVIDNGKGGKDTVTVDINNAKYDYLNKSAIPDFYGSIGNRFSYKGIDLSFLITYQVGGYVYDGAYGSLMNSGTYGNALHKDVLNRWQKPGDVTNVPRMDNAKTGIFGAASDRWLTRASYLSINNISLGYNLPRKLLSPFKAQNARVYISAENVHFFTARKGMNVNGNFSGSTGDTYDAARVISAGINLNF